MKENENEDSNEAKVVRIEKRELIQGFLSGNKFLPILRSREPLISSHANFVKISYSLIINFRSVTFPK
jgi:hypothetical protein